MKNYLCIENINSLKNETLLEIIKSSSEMEGYPITNILESDEKTLWLSTEELPQEIIINMNKDLFKEMPKKISGIGIYCWHAYPTNPKLIEIQISKNKGNTFISLGNFDLCLKPGKQLLQFDYEINPSLIKENISDIIIKLIIKETFGDKRTYINNIYLYENINLNQNNLLTNMEPIKEEDSNSLIYLRESREKVLNKNVKEMNTIEEKKEKINSEESQSLISDSDLSEKYNNKKENKDENKINNNIKNNDRYLNENENEILMEMNKQINLMLEKEEMKDIQQDNELSSKEKSLNINDFNNDEEENEINDNNENKKDINVNKEHSLNDSINEENLNLLIEEFENYKRIQEKRMFDYENKIKNLEIQFNEMTYLNNKMKETINTILENQNLQRNNNHEYILNNMKDIIYYKINNVFSNFNNFPNYNSPYDNQKYIYFKNKENNFGNSRKIYNKKINNIRMNKSPFIQRNNIYENNMTERNNSNYINLNIIDNNNTQNDFPSYSVKDKYYSITNQKFNTINSKKDLMKNRAIKEKQNFNDNE